MVGSRWVPWMLAIGALGATPGCDGEAALPDDGALDADARTEDVDEDVGETGDGDAAPADADGSGEDGDAAPADADGETRVPTPEDVDLAAVTPIPSGEVILYNDWNATPNAVRAVRPDGTWVGEILRIARAWSLGASRDGAHVALGGARYDEGTYWDLPGLGDAIQYTWLYETATEQVRLLAGGNVNDDCHAFAPDGSAVLVCRRWDFRREGTAWTWEGYRVASIDVASGAVTLLGDPDVQALQPAISPVDGKLYYARFEMVGGSPHYAVVARDLSTGAETPVRDNARGWSFSPDGSHAVFVDYADGGRLHVVATAGSTDVRVTEAPGGGASFSPDGTRIVYLFAESMTCSHVQIVLADGSDAALPTRVRDCATADEHITRAVWIARP